jgi:hypothetical protein
MKIFTTICTGLLLVTGIFFTRNHFKHADKPGLTIPSGENEENPELRADWEHRMLADPATGEIPEGIQFREQWFAAGLPKAAAERGLGAWASRGPWNVGGRTRALAVDVTDENRILAGGVSGGLWLSEDGGQTWARKTPMNAHPGCVSIAQDTRPGKTNTWYYLSGEVTGTSASGGAAFYLGDGMFKSTDGGNTWTPVSSTAGGSPNGFSTLYQTGWRVVTAPNDSLNVVYMATIGTIYRSANGGTTWTAVRGGNTANYSYYADVATTSQGVLYATLSSDGPQAGMWRSINGTNWVKINPDTSAGFPKNFDRFVIGINPNNENEVYFLGATPGYGHYNHYITSDDWTSLWKYTYISGNGAGANGTWENLSANLPSNGTEFDRFACQGGYDLVVKVQPGTNNVFVGGTNLYRSTDGFKTPNNTTHIGGYKPGTYLPFFELYDNHHPDQHDILFLSSNPNVMLNASDGGLHRTENCNAPVVSWTKLNNGYQTSQFYTAIFDKSAAGDQTLIGGLQDNGNFITTSGDPNAIWKQTINGDGSYGAIPDGKPYYILSIQQGRVAKCAIDNQGNVTAFRRIDPIGPRKGDYGFINPLVLDPTDQKILYLPAGRALYRQNDLNAIQMTGAWDSISQGWVKYPDTLVSTRDEFTAIAVSKTNPSHRIYLGTARNKLYRIDNAHVGTPNFMALASPLTDTTAYVSCIAVDPDNADDVTVVYSNYNIYSMFRSLNGGQSWIKVAGKLESAVAGTGSGPSLRWLSILPLPDGKRKYFCGTSVGLYSADTLILHQSTQIATNWTLESPDLIGTTVVPFVDVRPIDGYVVAATHGIGMFSANFLPPVGSKEPTNEVQIKVYPNPVQDQARFTWSEPGAVTLRLLDQQGKQVRQAAWTGTTNTLDVADLPKGVYFYELRGKNWRKSGKLLKE